jgi:DNA mismatch repair protein MutL
MAQKTVETPLHRRSVQVLNPEVARKIAAGEVIDRPAALVRELVDNSIDAGATEIEVAVEGGGSLRLEVIDNGIGMTREDLDLCWLPHATSKIRTIEDLSSAETLGFRGEALAAISAVAHLEMVSSIDGREAWKLNVGPGVSGSGAPRIEVAQRQRGTSVRVSGLFDSIPARKKFLKREGAEANLCRQALIDKALAFPNLGFRYLNGGTLQLFLPPVETFKDRFSTTVLREREGTFLHEISTMGDGFSVTLVVGGPELSRRDRRAQFVFANGRRIQEFSILQALEFGVQGWFPNGEHPIGAIFIDIDPALADFNIHPAKREVRFKDGSSIHHRITTALRDFFHRRGATTLGFPTESPQGSPSQVGEYRSPEGAFPHPSFYRSGAPIETTYGEGETRASRLALEALLEQPPPFPSRPVIQAPVEPLENGASEVRYLGQLFNLFILVEHRQNLYIIDQHAAHERILYNRFIDHPPPVQELLVPIPFRTETEEEDSFLRDLQKNLEELGVRLTQEGDGTWRIDALPAPWRATDSETVQTILALREGSENPVERWRATMACKAAIKDGDTLDSATALDLAREALGLPIPLCPHGRPIWKKIEKQELLAAVRRT